MENRQLFRQLGADGNGIGLPGIDGAIDCTHIRLSHTKFQNIQEVYRNRKEYFSLNVQINFKKCPGHANNGIHEIKSLNYLRLGLILIINYLNFLRYRQWLDRA